MTTVVAAKFLETQLRFTEASGEDSSFKHLPMPGIGAAGQRCLLEGNPSTTFDGGVTNAAQVVGWYMRLGGDAEQARRLLVDTCGCHAPSITKPINGTLAALREKCSGFVMDGTPAPAPAPAAAAGPETMVYARWLSRQLAWADTLDSNPVPGLGSVGRGRMVAAGVDSPAKLIGQFMIFNGHEEDFVEWCVQTVGLRSQDVRGEKKLLAGIKAKLAAFCYDEPQAKQVRYSALEDAEDFERTYYGDGFSSATGRMSMQPSKMG